MYDKSDNVKEVKIFFQIWFIFICFVFHFFFFSLLFHKLVNSLVGYVLC